MWQNSNWNNSWQISTFHTGLHPCCLYTFSYQECRLGMPRGSNYTQWTTSDLHNHLRLQHLIVNFDCFFIILTDVRWILTLVSSFSKKIVGFNRILSHCYQTFRMFDNIAARSSLFFLILSSLVDLLDVQKCTNI